MLSFTLMDMVAIFSFQVAACSLVFTIFKNVIAQVHGRIKEVKTDLTAEHKTLKSDFDAEIKTIKENYAQRVELSHAVASIREMVISVLNEQKHTSTRIDDLFKIFINKKEAAE